MADSDKYERLDNGSPDGSLWGGASTDKIGVYGATPVVQRTYSSAVHATSALATSADFGATQLAAVQEIQNTLIGLGIWATA
ncbi:hypothetical protein [Sulfurovum sp.]|uniref:hypothetical protein n=1 Tax=Sulfurovum sp. TaxID=1969726 RepID=UPI003568E980